MCNCGFEYRQVFFARVQYVVYQFDPSLKFSPTTWCRDEILVCLACGQITDYVPDAELLELRLGGGEPLVS